MKIFNSKIYRINGAALIEFAMVAPLLLLLCFGIVEFSLAFYKLNIATKAVHIGARYFSDPLVSKTGSNFSSAKIPEVQNIVVNASKTARKSGFDSIEEAFFDLSDVTVEIPPNSPIDHIRVSVSYEQSLEIPRFFDLAIPYTYTLTASSLLRVQ